MLLFVNLCFYACGKIKLILSTFSEQNWFRGSTGSGRVSEAKQNLHLPGTSKYVIICAFLFACMWQNQANILTFRQQYWFRGSTGSGRVFEGKHNPRPAESLLYVVICDLCSTHVQDQANIIHIQQTELVMREHRLWLSL